MLSRNVSITISIVMLVIFAFVVSETISNSAASTSTTPVNGITPGQLNVYSPQNNSAIMVTNSTDQINVTLFVQSNASPVYFYDVNPPSSPSYFSINNLTHFDSFLYPYNYVMYNTTSGNNTTIDLQLYFNSTAFEEMKSSVPPAAMYLYAIAILIENSGSASFIGFVIYKI